MPDKDDSRSLPVPSDKGSKPVQLHDNGVRASNLIDRAIGSLGEEEMKALGLKAGEKVIDLKAQESRQNLEYVAAKKAVEDHIDSFDKLDKDGKTTGHKVTTEVNTSTGKIKLESKSGATCFVATAAFGDPSHPDVEFLRWFRDNTLNRNASGRAFIKAYWVVGPHLAQVVLRSPTLQIVVRNGLGRLVQALRVRRDRA